MLSTTCLIIRQNLYGEKYYRYWGTIDVGNNVFIGAKAILLPNITIGNNVIIAAGSLINSDIPDGVVVAGIPAKIIGEVENMKEKRRLYNQTDLAKMIRSERIAFLWEEKGTK